MSTRTNKQNESKTNEVLNTTAAQAAPVPSTDETVSNVIGVHGEDYAMSATITKVMQSQSDGRVSFVLDKTFAGYSRSGEETETQILGTNVYNLVNEVGAQVPELQLAEALCLGKPINPQIVALVLTNATIEVVREFKQRGEERQNAENGEVYSNDCFVTRFKKVKTHINQLFAKHIQTLLATQPSDPTAALVIANPFNV